MRLRTDQSRESERGRSEPLAREAPVPVAAPSSDPVRALRAALREAARRRAGHAVEAAAEALEARAKDPKDPTIDQSRIDAHLETDLDSKAAHGIDQDGPVRDALAMRMDGFAARLSPGRPPEARILAPHVHATSARDSKQQDEEGEEPEPAAEREAKPARSPAVIRRRPRERTQRSAGADNKNVRDRAHGSRDWRHAPPEGVSSSDALKHEEQLRRANAKLQEGPKFKSAAPSAGAKVAGGAKSAPPPKKEALPPKPKANAPASESGDPAVAAWQDRQAKKVDKLEAGQIPDSERYVVTFTAAGSTAAALTDSKKLELINSASKAVKPMDQPEEAPAFPDPDKFADAHKLVTDAVNKKLKPQTLKPMDVSPLGNVPKVGMSLTRGQDQQLHVMQEVDDHGKTIQKEVTVVADDGKGKSSTDKNVIEIKTAKPSALQKPVDELRKAGAAKQAAARKKPIGPGLTIQDDRPLSAPEVPAFAKVDIGTVVAKVFAREPYYASKVVDEARAAFASGTMTTAETNEFIGDEQALVDAKLQEIRKAAGVTDAELAKKTAAEHDKLSKDVEAKNAEAENSALATKTVFADKGASLHDQITDLADGLIHSIDDKEAMTKGGFDRKEIETKRDDSIAESDARVKKWIKRYQDMGKRRGEQLKESSEKEAAAYDATAELDFKQIDLQLGVKTHDEKDLDGPEYAPSRDWRDQTKLELRVDVAKAVKDGTDQAERLKTDLETAGEMADAKITAWAEERMNKERSWWDRLIRAIIDWLVPAKKAAKDWGVDNSEDNNKNLAKDMLWLEKARIAGWKDLDAEQIKDSHQFTEEQKAMLLAMKSGADAPTALAEGLVSRISQQEREGLQKKFEAKVMTFTDPMRVQEIGAGQKGKGADDKFAVNIATTVYAQGVNKVGTGEKEIFDALSGLTPIQGRAVELVYNTTYKRNLRDDLRDEMYDAGEQLWGTTHDWDKSIALLEGSSAKAAAIDLEEAMHGGMFGLGLGTDDKTIWATLKGKTPAEIAEFRRQFRALTGRDLITDVDAELDDGWSTWHDDARFHALVEGDIDRARVIEADSDMRGSAIFGLKTDRKGVQGVFEEIQKDVLAEGAAKEWSTNRIQQEIAKRYAAFDDQYEYQVGGSVDDSDRAIDPKTGKKESALTTVMKQSFTWGTGKAAYNFTKSSADLDILLSYQAVAAAKDDPDLGKVFKQQVATIGAATVQDEHRGIFSSSDKEENKAIASAYETAYADHLRDDKLALKKEEVAARTALQREIDGKREAANKLTDPAERKKRLDEIKKEETAKTTTLNRTWAPAGAAYLARIRQLHEQASNEAQLDAKETFKLMGDTFDAKYQAWNATFSGDAKDAKFADIVRMDTRVGSIMGHEIGANDKTRALLASGGYLSDEDKLYYSIKGAGTDEETAKSIFADRDSVEAEAILKRLGKRLQREDGDRLGGTAAEQDAAALGKAKDWVLDDFSGRELQDQTIAMMGVPHTPSEFLAIAKKRRDFEYESGPNKYTGVAPTVTPPNLTLGVDKHGVPNLPVTFENDPLGRLTHSFDAETLNFLDWQVQRLEAAAAEADKLAAEGKMPGDKEYDEALERVSVISEAVNAAVELHRSDVDAMADLVTEAIQVVVGVVTLIAGIILTPVTGGLSTAIAIAVVSALATTALTMAAKAAIKGSAYGWEEALGDATSGIVEALAAGLTAGFGGPMLKGMGLVKTELDGVVSALVKKTLGHFVTGAIQAAPGALVGALINDASFADALGGILQGGLMAVAIGTATEPVVEHFQAAKALNTRTSPVEFEKGYQHFLKENPGAPVGKFRAELDRILFEAHPAALRDPEVQARMRGEMLETMPPELRGKYHDAQIEVVSEAAFKKAGGKGLAIVETVDGVTTVKVKPGTDLARVGHIAETLAPTAAPSPGVAKPGATAPEHEPVPHGGSASPDPRAPAESTPRQILEPMAGPNLQSSIELQLRNPDANVTATERTIKPDAIERARAERAGVTVLGENKSSAIAPSSIDEIKMRFPIPTERTLEQDWMLRFKEVQELHPTMDRLAQYDLATKMTLDLAESLTAYAPYALERLKPGGELEVVFHESSIVNELGDVSRMRLVDPETGKAYRLELVDLQVRTRGEVAPHSGFGIPEMTNATEVRVARFEKVELESKLPMGARGPDIAGGEVVGKYSGRGFTPSEAGGRVRELDFAKIKFTERGVDVVERHVKSFDAGGGDMELAMLERLRAISAGKLEPTDFDRAFYSHELRESVRYRALGLADGVPVGVEYEVWNNAHTATLEDYRLREKLPGGGRALFHPDVVERFAASPTGARGPSEPLAQRLLGADGELPTRARARMRDELVDLGVPREQLRTLSDRDLVGRYVEAQITEAPKRVAEFRKTLSPEGRQALDELQGATELHQQPVDADVKLKLETALATPIEMDPTLPIGEVRIGTDGRTLHVHPDATLGDVLGHIPAVGALKRYQGAIGMVRRVGEAIGRVFGRGGPPFGTVAHEAWLEIQKLPGLIESRRVQLLDRSLDFETRARIQDEVTRIEGQLARHVADLGDLSEGRGYVAVEGRAKKLVSSPDAKTSKLPPLDATKFPPEVQQVLAKGKGWVHDAKLWTRPEVAGMPNGEYIYIVRNGDGEVLKVGKSSYGKDGSALDARMGLYRRAAEMTGREVQVELYAVTASDAEPFETGLRKQLYEKNPAADREDTFRWDNKVEHRKKFIGPGTPGESPTGKETVEIVSAEPAHDGEKKIRVRHDDGYEQDITTRKTGAQAGKSFEIPRDELYGWVKNPKDPQSPIFARGGSTSAEALVKPMTEVGRIEALPNDLRRAKLEALLVANRGVDADGTVENSAAALGIKSWKMYKLLREVSPKLRPSELPNP